MNDIHTYTPNPGKPRLWVETLWLLDTLTARHPLREIHLQRGLNLIVSPPGTGSAGHGVGKTAFCQLLRFVLDDPLWSDGSSLRDELLHSHELKEGAVAARVHVGGETWTVLKPWLHQKQYRASRTADWCQLATNNVENEFTAYQAALRRHLVEILPVQNLPGSEQPIEWHQILAWCSRDQNARYQNYYQWRADGSGFSWPAKSPAALMQIVLGLLPDASTLRELDAKTKTLEKLRAELHTLREEPGHLLKHVRSQLARYLDASVTTPFRQDGLLEHANLIGLAKQRHEAYQQELLTCDAQRQRLSEQRQIHLAKRAPLKVRIGLLSNEIEQMEALARGDMQEVERLQKETSSLQQQLTTRCDAGNRLLKDCSHVQGRIDHLQIDRSQRIKQHQHAKETLENELVLLRHLLAELKTEEAPISQQLASINQQDTELTKRYAQILSADQLLGNAIEDYERYEGMVTGKLSSPEIEKLERQLQSIRLRHDQLQIQRDNERAAAGMRRQAINAAMHAVAQSLPSFHWGVFDDDGKHRNRPFQMGPMHSTTFKVLEILAGDIACLIDSAAVESFHPGFLLHDSPREAEMSESMLWALLGHVTSDENSAFQYIVTTSTEPAEAFKPYERLRLSSDSEDGLLLRQRIGAEQRPLM